jgi:3-oxoadipate CoA-transferase alpha subunit
VINKIIPGVVQAVQDIADGSTILVSGFGGAGSPFYLLDALAEQGAKNLIIISNNAGNSGIGIAKLIGKGQVRKVVLFLVNQSPAPLMTYIVLEKLSLS